MLDYIGKKKIDLKKMGIEIDEFKIYCEPFAGSFNNGINLMKQGYKGKLICNDIDSNLYNYWRQLIDNFDNLVAKCDSIDALLINRNRNEINDILSNMMSSADDTERAAAYFLRQSTKGISGYREYNGLEKMFCIKMYILRYYMEKVKIYNEHYYDIFNKFDKEDTFWFVDPPYMTDRVKMYYEHTMTQEQHIELGVILKNIKGKFLLTYNNCELIKDLYSEFNIIRKDRSLGAIKTSELYISNF